MSFEGEDDFDLSDLLSGCEEELKLSMPLRCRKVGLEDEYEMGKCVEVQDWAVSEMVLEIENDQDMYYNLREARSYPKMISGVREGADYWCERAFRPNAEEELRELRERSGDRAKDIANDLFAPFVEQFLELPVQVRRDRYEKCKTAADAAVHEMDRCIARGAKR